MAVSTRPERATACEMTKADPTMITMSSEKPSNALAAGMIPAATPATRASSATRS